MDIDDYVSLDIPHYFQPSRRLDTFGGNPCGLDTFGGNPCGNNGSGDFRSRIDKITSLPPGCGLADHRPPGCGLADHRPPGCGLADHRPKGVQRNIYNKPDVRTRNKYYDVCNNCGKQGHTFKQCKNPITSFGVIIFRIHQNQRQYLMIRRKDTLGYIDFMRGKYSMSNQNYILNMFKQMTVQEKHKLMTYTFEELWKDLWDGEDLPITTVHETHDSNPDSECKHDPRSILLQESSSGSNYRQEESNSREKFNYLSSKIMGGNASNPHHMYILPSGQTILKYLLMVSNIPDIWKCEADPIPHEGGGWSEPEWGFPKGRRNFQEKDYECALREMTEETGYPSHLVKNIKNILPFDEIFMGSNYKSYKHRYYLMYMNYDDSLIMDNFEKSEVSRMEWKSYEECMATIRPYNLEKKRIITQIEHTLSRYRLFL